MLGSITPLGERGRGNRWWLTAASYTAASALGGLLVGSAAGLLGATLRLGGLTLAPAAALLVISSAALLGLLADAGLFGLRLPTLRRQVDDRWIGRYRGWVVGAGFGFQLGLGVVTIITASATWAALAAAAASQSVLGGALVGLAFGGLRAVPLLVAGRTATPDAVRRLHLRVAALARPADRLIRSSQAGVAAAALLLALPALA